MPLAQPDHALPSRPEWPLANPWPWMVAAVLSSALAFFWVRFFDENWTAFRIILVAVGCISAGIALAIRLTTSHTAFVEGLSSRWRSYSLVALSLLGIILVVGTLLHWTASYNTRDLPFVTETALVIFVLTLAGWGGFTFFNLQAVFTKKPISTRHEKALFLLLASLCAFLGCWALYLDHSRVEEWDSMRRFLAVVTMAAFFAAPLVLLPTLYQRILISLFIIFHFGNILVATMRPPPQPWLITQLWTRVYRPYSQFMFLNNAYHFYAPEPSPSSYLWCRLEYEKDGQILSHWIKSPKVTEEGRADYLFSLQYQRRIAMNDQVSMLEGSRLSMLVPNRQGAPMINPLFLWRKIYSDSPPEPTLGIAVPKSALKVPFHPLVATENQYQKPNFYSSQLLHSYARHLSELPHPEYPDATFLSVRIYRVVHIIPTLEMMLSDLSPTNPVLYQPYYMGKYGWTDRSPEGKKIDTPVFNLLDEPIFDQDGNLKSGDPLLYWLIPILPADKYFTNLEEARINAWIFRHAGDQKWVYPPGASQPVAP